MANETNRRASLRPLNHPNVRGWTVVGADGRKVGQVRDLLADPEDGERFFAVELDQTALQQEGDAYAGRYLADPNRPGARPQADVDPTVGESERTASLNTGSRQHVDAFTGAVPRDDDREGGSGRVEPLHVLVPFTAARLKETDEQVVLETLREIDLARLPALA
ncbi:MAG TPA: PRC-barrel domain-containing protein [Thermoanaerobaculia bacterium]|nr:PRC-barrel domain-containing protein [Thermoanaerobaculia bacterium]